MTVAHNAIGAGALALLLTPPAIAGGQVKRGQTRPVADTVQRFVGITLAGSDPDRVQIRGNPVEWSTTLRASCCARGTTSVGVASTGEENAIELFGEVYARLLSEPTLGGAAWDVEPGPVDLEQDELDSSLACVTATFRVRHRTAANTLEV